MEKEIKSVLINLSDDKYREFSSGLLPGTDNILGVRLPELRKMARDIARNGWKEYLAISEYEYFEEIMLYGMVIGYVKSDIEDILKYVKKFVPMINNWSVCDSFCSGLKFTRDNMQMVWEFLQPYFQSEEEYHVRFGVVMIINYFVEPDYIDDVLVVLKGINNDGYYVKMAVAWALSICYIKFPNKTFELINNNQLDDFTFNKALQKITESNRVDAETKQLIRSMKRKSKN